MLQVQVIQCLFKCSQLLLKYTTTRHSEHSKVLRVQVVHALSKEHINSYKFKYFQKYL